MVSRGFLLLILLFATPGLAGDSAGCIEQELRISSYRENPQIFNALSAVSADYRKQPGRSLEGLIGFKTDPEFIKARENAGAQWLNSLKNKELPELRVSSKKIRTVEEGGASIVQIVTRDDGSQIVFRPAQKATPGKYRSTRDRGGNITAARLTLLASNLNEELGLRTFSRSWPGKLNGKIGVFSEYVPHTIEESAWAYDLTRRTPRLNRFRDLEAFSFLVYDGETNLGWNVRTFTENSYHGPPLDEIEPATIDHDDAFPAGIEPYGASQAHTLGHRLPELYTRSFIEKLRALTPERLKEKFSDLAGPSELRGLIFRRDLILKDVELRGDQAFLPETK